jgi:hypothetical protein
MDLPVWQKLYEELGDQGFTIVAVAMDSRGERAVRGPITKAKTTYVSLIDRDHVVAELYNMVNVPQAVWIDESGSIVRPTEVSGAALTPDLRKLRRRRQIYLDAIRDWVAKGPASEHVFTPDEARERIPTFTPQIAEAQAHFHLGRDLWEQGNRDEGAAFLRRATELNPDSWNFFRQMKNLEHILGSGGPAFFLRARRARKAGKPYYALPDMKAMAEVAD